MISDLNRMGAKIYAVKKFNGSIKYGIGLIKSYNIHLVKNKDLQKEQENYAWRTVNGISLGEPIKEHDHYWDAVRYIAISKFRKS